jgi:CBS domain-containing protein
MSDITQHSSLPGESLPRPQPHKRYHLGVDSEYSEEDLQSFREQEWGGATVDDIMTPMVFDVSEDASVQTIADTMLKGRIHRVLVTRKKHLVGIITALDLIRVIRDL